MVNKQISILMALLVLTTSLVMISQLEYSTKIFLFQLMLYVIAEILFVLSAVYIWRKTNQILNIPFFLRSGKSRTLKFTLKAILATICILANFCFFLMAFKVHQPLLATISFTLVGFFIKFTFLFVTTKLIIYLIYTLSSLFINYKSSSKQITHQITTITYLTSLLIAILLTTYGSYNAWRDPQIKEVNITIPRFPFSNFTFLVLSDIHLGHTVDQARIQHIADIAKTLKYGLFNRIILI